MSAAAEASAALDRARAEHRATQDMLMAELALAIAASRKAAEALREVRLSLTGERA